jgi:hypothetical protein
MFDHGALSLQCRLLIHTRACPPLILTPGVRRGYLSVNGQSFGCVRIHPQQTAGPAVATPRMNIAYERVGERERVAESTDRILPG